MTPPNPTTKERKEEDMITLKWGSLKSWNIKTPKAFETLKKWAELGTSVSAIAHYDTDEQKRLLCQLIDECNLATIYLDWDGKDVSKEEAKDYIMNYGKK